MSVLLADIDATCAALGYNDGENYHAEPDAIQGLKHLIWILRRDLDNHEYRRHLGQSKVLQTDLIPMLQTYIDDDEYSDVLIRLLVILTNPTLLLYRDGIPKDNHGRKIYLELIDILQGYKEGFTSNYIWASLGKRLHKVLDCDWALRSEDQTLLIERILVLVRNVLQVPSNPEVECRADNDASLHDQIIWALHQSGMLDLSLYILSSTDENQYHLHALEILCLLYREQTAASLADASLQRSAIEKQRDEQELIAARRREKQKLIAHPPPGRHSRFGGTYVLQNVKSISDKDIICHQSLERAVAIDLDIEKTKQKRNFRLINEENFSERRSAFSVRLCLREYCIEVLRSAYNTLVRQVRRVLERNSNSGSHDDSYLLWAIRFFMEFNRLSGLQLHLVSESLSVQCFHWVLTRMQHHMDMISSDKKQSRLWARRLHVAIQTFRELLFSLLALQKLKDDKAYSLFDMLLNNVCYVLEYRETILHLLMNYNESHSTKAFLRDIVETANIFMKMMEKFCKDTVVVQDKRKVKNKRKPKKNKSKISNSTDKNDENYTEELENKWAGLSTDIAVLLANDDITSSIPDHEIPIPFDAASDINIDDQKEDCVLRILSFLRDEKFQQAIVLMRSAREVWPENHCFGSVTAAPEDELMLLREIYLSNLKTVDKPIEVVENDDDEGQFDEAEEYGDEDEPSIIERDLRFEDIAKRLVNPKIVHACTLVLSDWEKISTKSLIATVTILHRIAFGCSSPAMLYQIALFRIFQRVFDAPRDSHHEELRRLGTYVIRKFIETAPKNPKIYAELLFYKSIREANELESGYVENYSVGAKGAWNEEQENELQMLFEENQNNPQNDQDVIDWILDNLIDKTRTRRGVLKKLKELGLMFKAPTKKSSATAANKNLWQHDEDEQLKNVYDEFRIENNCLERILQVFGEKRTKQNIISRMIQLHLIADKSEILPPKKSRKSTKNQHPQYETSDSDVDNDNIENNDIFGNTTLTKHRTLRKSEKKKSKQAPKRNVIKTPLDIGSIRALLAKIDATYNDAIDWLKESITDAAEDADENHTDEDDGIPLLPLLDIQKDAMENDEFKKLLLSLGIQPPIQEMETYWRIPVYLTEGDLQLRVKIINGDEIADNDNNFDNDENDETDINSENMHKDDFSSDEGSEVDFLDNLMNKRREKLNNLVYNKSDNEDDYRSPLKLTQKKKLTKNKNIASGSSVRFNDVYDEDDIAGNNNKTDDKKKNRKLSKWNINNMVNDDINDPIESTNSDNGMGENTDADVLDFDSENLRLRLAELNDSDNENDISNTDVTIKPNNNNIQRPIRRRNIIDSDSSGDEIEKNSIIDDHSNAIKKQAENEIDITEKGTKRINNNKIDDDSDGEYQQNSSITITTNNNQSLITNKTTKINDDISNYENYDGDFDEGTLISTTNKQRGLFDDENDVEGNGNSNKILSDDEITVKRKRTAISDDSEDDNYGKNNPHHRRRRIAVIDDDDDE